PAADDDDAFAAELGQHELAGVRNRVGAADADPHLAEDPFLFAGVDGGIVEITAGQRRLKRGALGLDGDHAIAPAVTADRVGSCSRGLDQTLAPTRLGVNPATAVRDYAHLR